MPFAEANGLTLAYEEQGKGVPLVLVAGIGMQLVGWPAGFLARLAARGLRVIVFDNRDVGLSTKLDAHEPPNIRLLPVRALLGLSVGAPYTLFDMAQDVVGLLDALGLERAHLAGASMGGMVAQATAIAHGPRLASMVSMMSFSGGTLFPGRISASMKLIRRPPRTREQSIDWHVSFFRAVGSTGLFRDDVALAERAGRAWDRSSDPAGYARQFAASLATGDLRPRLRGVRVPTLVLHGSVDAIFRPARGRETADAIPGARFQLVDGWGHDLAEGAWQVLVEAIAGHVLAHA